MRKSAGPLRIIAVSGGGRYLNGKYCANLAEALGADFALMKPVRPEKLVRIVEAGQQVSV